MDCWRSWCARPPEERKDQVRSLGDPHLPGSYNGSTRVSEAFGGCSIRPLGTTYPPRTTASISALEAPDRGSSPWEGSFKLYAFGYNLCVLQ